MKIDPRTEYLRDGRFIELRSPEPADASAALDFLRQLSRESFRNLNYPPSYFGRITLEEETSFLESILVHRANFMISAWLEEAIVGNISLTVSGATFSSHSGELGLGVLKDFWGLGLGRMLMRNLIAAAEQGGISNLTLRVRTFNERAIRLYESVGFKRVGVLTSIVQLPDGSCVDEYLYQRISPAR